MRNEVGTVEEEKRSSSPARTCVAIQSITLCRTPDHNCYSSALPRSGIVRKWNTGMQPQEQNTDVTHDSLELLRIIPANRTTGHETAEKRPDYVAETELARNN